MTEYYVIKSKETGLYFRGKGANRWGKHYNQATIYLVKRTAEHSIKEIAWHGEQAEIVPIRILDGSADVAPVVHGRWIPGEPDKYGNRKPICSVCGEYRLGFWSDYAICNYCPNCGAKMDLEEN